MSTFLYMSLEQTVRNFCKEHGLELKKSLGQNYLVDQEVLDAIIKAAQIEEEDHILEIGAGIGILTKELIQKAKHVTAIEIDERAVELLPKYLGSSFDTTAPQCHLECPDKDVSKDDIAEQSLRMTEGLILHKANALETPFPHTPYKIVANIPYHITSALLHKAFIEEQCKPTSVTLMIQKEVAEKICTDTDGSRLTILVKLFGTPKLIRTVPASAFLPPPKVDSAVIHIQSHSEPLAGPETIERVFNLTKVAFGQRRKMLRNTIDLKLLESAGIDPSRRPQTLSVGEWITLACSA